MELLIKVGNKRNPTDTGFDQGWKDGQVVENV